MTHTSLNEKTSAALEEAEQILTDPDHEYFSNADELISDLKKDDEQETQ